MLCSVPAELLDAIALLLDDNNLCALARTTSRLAHVAQRILLRHIHLHAPTPALLTALATKPHLAAHVRSFALRLPPTATVLPAFYRLLARAIANMGQLTALDLFLPAHTSWLLTASNTTIYPRLHRFSAAFDLDHHLLNFLARADALRELDLSPLHQKPATHHYPPLSPGLVPRLASFTGPPALAHHIVPSRPVDTIHLNSGDLTDDIAETLAKSTAPIQVLMATTSSHSVSVLGTLTRFMPNLNHLRVLSTYPFVDVPDTAYFANIADALAGFPLLRSCEIWGMLWVERQRDHRGKVWQSELFAQDLSDPHLPDYPDIYHA